MAKRAEKKNGRGDPKTNGRDQSNSSKSSKSNGKAAGKTLKKSTRSADQKSLKKKGSAADQSAGSTDELVDRATKASLADIESPPEMKKDSIKPFDDTTFDIHKEPREKLFPIVAIGGSAGALEATKELISNLDPQNGIAYVIIHHLAPDFKSMLREIFERETSMPVKTAEDKIRPEPNTIYVIHEDETLVFSGGLFRTSPRTKKRKVHMAIDYFMRSLAEDSTHFPIGVILSGADSDGVIGLENIKTQGGLTFAQDRNTAAYPAMPLAAIANHVVDFEMEVKNIALEINKLGKNPFMKTFRPKDMEEMLPPTAVEIQEIYKILQKKTGVDFTNYKPSTVKRRILRRIVYHKFTDIKSYVKKILADNNEVYALYEDILINVTSFFRDGDMYESFQKKILPAVFEGRAPDSPVRIWSTACSTGEEAYSLAICVMEYLEDKKPLMPVNIFATDLSDKGIEKARKGVYPGDIIGDISPERLLRYFVKFDGKYQVNKSIRDMCIFAKHNLVQDPPFSKIDVISCRNVLIYLGDVLQKRVMPIFHYALKPAGYLVLGTSETIGTFGNLFKTVDKKIKIYQKRSTLLKDQNDLPVLPFTVKFQEQSAREYKTMLKPASTAMQKEADDYVLNKYAPSSVVITGSFEVLQIRGNTDLYLGMAEGEATHNLLKLAKKPLAMDIKAAVNKAAKQKTPVIREGIKVYKDQETLEVNLIVVPLETAISHDPLYLVIFEQADKLKGYLNKLSKEPGDTTKEGRNIIEGLRHDLTMSKSFVQDVIEQQESTNEELRSANEEIQSANEELQSTNEELETSKEELQSANEELLTVNEELQNGNQMLSQVNSDLGNLLSSINIPIIILDTRLNIRKYTGVAEKILNLIPTDVGRSILDINSKIKIENLEELLRDVIDTPTTKEFETTDKAGNWYLVRIRPYKTLENKIDGALIAVLDINDIKKNVTRLEDYTKQVNDLNRDLEKEITERKNVENSLRILSSHLVDAQEASRLQLSRELHDGINQILTSAKMRIHEAEGMFEPENDNNKNALSKITDGRILLEKTISEVRRMAKNLRPLSLEEFGISESLSSMCEEFTERTSIKIKCDIEKVEERFSPDIELALYRLLQEALFNVEKHSTASEVTVSLNIDNVNINFTISDNGQGFDLEKYKKNNTYLQRLGLIGLKERAEYLKGKFEINSRPGKGTIIYISLPAVYKDEKKPEEKSKKKVQK